MISKKEAENFLYLVNLFIYLAKINCTLFIAFNLCIHARVIFYAYFAIPFKYIILSHIPNAISFYIVIFLCFQSANFSFLVFLFSNLFTLKSIRSSTNRKLLSFLNDKKVNAMAKVNLKVIKDILVIFSGNQKFINLHFTGFYSVMLIICFTFPYALIFGENSLLSFMICFALYSQAMLNPLYSASRSNQFIHEAFHIYGSFLHHLILKCQDVKLKIKLENFYSLHQRHNPLSFKYHQLFYFTHYFLLKVIFIKLQLIFFSI